MSKYQASQISQTFQTVVIIGLIAGSSPMFATSHPEICQIKSHAALNEAGHNATYSNGVASTLSTRLGISNQIYEGTYLSTLEDNFESAVSRFYAVLTSNQERLGADFEKVLFDNLWDLYD